MPQNTNIHCDVGRSTFPNVSLVTSFVTSGKSFTGKKTTSTEKKLLSSST